MWGESSQQFSAAEVRKASCNSYLPRRQWETAGGAVSAPKLARVGGSGGNAEKGKTEEGTSHSDMTAR